jgi:hypothetical protein
MRRCVGCGVCCSTATILLHQLRWLDTVWESKRICSRYLEATTYPPSIHAGFSAHVCCLSAGVQLIESLSDSAMKSALIGLLPELVTDESKEVRAPPTVPLSSFDG